MAGLLVQELGSGCSGIQCHAPTVPMYSFSGSLLVFGCGAPSLYNNMTETVEWWHKGIDTSYDR